MDSFAFDQVSFGVNEGRFGVCRAANLALIVCLVSRAESRWTGIAQKKMFIRMGEAILRTIAVNVDFVLFVTS